jgi:hypothetical protein
MHDSFTAIGGMVPLINMQLGEVIIGGVGAGMYGMLLFVIISIFVAGLMVGRTPEYVGKKIEARGQDGNARHPDSAVDVSRLAGGRDAGPVGGCFDGEPRAARVYRILYAYVSADANNGSAFAGLSGNTLFYNITLAIAMLVGRFWMIIPMMAIAGALAARKLCRRRPARSRQPAACSSVWSWRRRDRRRPHVLPGAGARPDRRAARDACRHALLIGPIQVIPWKPLNCASGCRYRRCSIPRSCCRRSARRS